MCVSFFLRSGAAAAGRCALVAIGALMACATCGFAADVDVSTPALTVPQVYRGTSYRDPFKVAVVFGDEHGPKSKTALSDVASSTFSIYNLSLVGIMEDSRSKEALFSDKTTGLVYTLKGGRLLDSKKKQVPGVSGVVKGKQVVLMTEDKKIHQLNLHEKESPDPE